MPSLRAAIAVGAYAARSPDPALGDDQQTPAATDYGPVLTGSYGSINNKLDAHTSPSGI